MRGNCKNIISGFFLLLGLTPIFFLLLVMVQKKEIRENMKHKLETNQLQTIVLPEEKVLWMDKHEIWVNEHMFDIHSKKLENGIYTFTGLYDEDETELVKKEQKATGNSAAQNKLLVQFFKHLPAFYDTGIAYINTTVLQQCYNLFASQQSINQYKEIITPPPQVC